MISNMIYPLMAIAAAGSVHGIDTANLDPSVAPGDDFYEYACGGWMQNNPLQPEYARFGMFDLLRENAREQLRDLITNLAENPESKVSGTNAQKVSDLYAMGMDSVRLNTEGAAPLRPLLDKIDSYRQKEDLAAMLGWLHGGVTGSFFNSGVGADPKNSDMNILHIGETGLSLGDRDYYLEDTEENLRIRDAYRTYVKRIMELAGYDPERAERAWQSVITLETEFARHKKTREERRNPQLRYNPMTFDEFCARFPNFDWRTYLETLGVAIPESLNVSGLGFIEWLNDYLPTLTAGQINDYVVFEAISESSNLLSDDFVDANFEMFDRVMSGKEEQQPRWKRAMAIPGSMLGEAVGQLYVEKYFPEENKAAMMRLVGNLKSALGEHIDALTWMSDSTKAKAREKLATFTVKIGYPDKWKDYSAITIDPNRTYLENVLEASRWYVADNYSKLGKPVDKEEWHMTPQTVNAYYMPTTNEICFPAAILQPPYFDPNADEALNYGAIGVVIGHEMTHGFDDQGRRFDLAGNLNDWWQPADADAFNALADRLVEQFDAVEVAPGVHANGRYTLGENIADQGGLRIALSAYLKEMEGREMQDIDGFSPLQRFFLSYAGLWASNIRPEEVLVLTKSDPHSLGRNRVNVTLRNLEPFFSAFSIGEGDPMFRPEQERVIIW